MRTEREGRPLAGAREMRGFRVVEDDGEDPNLNPRVLENALHGGEEDSGAGADTPGVKEVVAAINAQWWTPVQKPSFCRVGVAEGGWYEGTFELERRRSALWDLKRRSFSLEWTQLCGIQPRAFKWERKQKKLVSRLGCQLQ